MRLRNGEHETSPSLYIGRDFQADGETFPLYDEPLIPLLKLRKVSRGET